MKKYTCLIVEDEKLAQELLEGYIRKISTIELIASCYSAIEAMQVLAQKKVDILFLDIQMPELTGLDFLRSLNHMPTTVLTTAHSDYAIESYELGVADYLLKPIEFDRFLKAINKVFHLLKSSSDINLPHIASVNEKPIETYFFIKTENKIVRVAFDELLFVEALQKYVKIHTTSGRIVSLLSLSKMMEMLPSNQFVRIHRSFLVNIDKVDSIEGNMIKIKEHTLPISKGKRDLFMDMLKKKGLFN